MAEYIRSSDSIGFIGEFGEMTRRYNESMNDIIQDYRYATHQMCQDYSTTIKRYMNDRTGYGSLDEHTTWMAQNVTGYLDMTTSRVDDMIEAQADVFINRIPEADMPIWRQVRDLTEAQASQIINSVRMPQTQQAMWIARDRFVLSKAKQAAGDYGIDHEFTQQVLSSASNQLAEDAMKLSLDKRVWDAVQLSVDVYGFGSKEVKEALNMASSPAVRAALTAALDRDILLKYSSLVSQHGFGYPEAEELLKNASSDTVRMAMKRHAKNLRQSSDKQMPDIPGQIINLSDHRRRHGKDVTPPQVEDTAFQESPRVTAARQLVWDVVSKNHDMGWLASVDPENILRVMETVYLHRLENKRSGRMIGDAEIIAGYKREIRRADRRQDPNKYRLELSLAILRAIKEGSGGKLPF